MNNPNAVSQPLVESYLFLRKAIGIIGNGREPYFLVGGGDDIGVWYCLVDQR